MIPVSHVLTAFNKTVFFKSELKQTPVLKLHSVTKGDLHGNLLSALNMLIEFNAIHISKEDYNKIEEIFYRSEKVFILENGLRASVLTEADYHVLVDAVSKIQILDDKTLFRFLGDIVNDRRGQSHANIVFFVLLKMRGLNISRINSNHDLDFFENFNAELPHCSPVGIQGTYRDAHFFLFDHNNKEPVALCEKLRGYIYAYFKDLELISYSAENDTMYTHAPVHTAQIVELLSHLKDLMTDFKITEGDIQTLKEGSISKERFALIVSEVNKFICEFLFSQSSAQQSDFTKKLFQIARDFVWYRNSFMRLPHDIKIANKLVLHVHGHDGLCTSVEDVEDIPGKISLDNLKEKYPPAEHLCQNSTFDPLYESFRIEHEKFETDEIPDGGMNNSQDITVEDEEFFRTLESWDGLKEDACGNEESIIEDEPICTTE